MSDLLKKLREDVFKAPSSDEVSKRKKERPLPKVKLYAWVVDQEDAYADGVIGEFAYDRLDHVYLDDNGEEVDLDKLADEYREAHYSTNVSVRVVDRKFLENIKKSIEYMLKDVKEDGVGASGAV